VARRAGIAVPAVAAVGVLGALVIAPYLHSLGSPAPAAAGQAAVAAGQGMTSLSLTPDRTVNAAGLPAPVRAAGNQYWARHPAATSSPEKPAAARPAPAPARAADQPGSPPARAQHAVVTSSSGHGVSCTGSGGTLKPLNYGAIVTFLTAHGYSDNAAAGIAGNIYAESGGNPRVGG
jgi:tail lysozyme